MMNSVSNNIANHLKSLHWQYDFDANTGCFLVGMVKLNHVVLDLKIISDDVEQRLVIHSTLPLVFPESNYAELLRLVNWVNCKIYTGRFCLDTQSGLLSNRSYGILRNIPIKEDVISVLLHCNLNTFDRYAATFLKLISLNNPSNSTNYFN